MSRTSSLALLVTAVFLMGAPSQALAQDKAARSGVFFKLGQAFNRALVANPKPRTNHLGLVDRVHYATNVYHYEGVATSDKDVLISRGLFVHIDLERPKKVKVDHSLAE